MFLHNEWDEEMVSLVFLTAINDVCDASYNNLFRRIMQVISDEEQIRKLKSCNSIQEIESILFSRKRCY